MNNMTGEEAIRKLYGNTEEDYRKGHQQLMEKMTKIKNDEKDAKEYLERIRKLFLSIEE